MHKTILLVLDKFCEQAAAPLTPCPPTYTSEPASEAFGALTPSLLEEITF